MKLLELANGQRRISSRLAVRTTNLRTEMRLVLDEDAVEPEASIIANFKPWLMQPAEKHSIVLPDGVVATVTGLECCEAYLRGLRRLMETGGRKIVDTTEVRIAEPALPRTDDERRNYRNAVLEAARRAGMRVQFFEEPDAVFEYFRVVRGGLPLDGRTTITALVIDFGGGTCNVSAVVTAKATGELLNRYLAQVLTSDAKHTGGVYVDREVLRRAVKDQGQGHLRQFSKESKARALFDRWLDRHSTRAETVKKLVSERQQAFTLSVPWEELAAHTAPPGLDHLEFVLEPDELRKIVEGHWNQSIKSALDTVVNRTRDRLVKTLKRTDVGPETDARGVFTDVIVAGGSSRLPGFADLVRGYFLPMQPRLHFVERDYQFAVAVGMAVNYLGRRGALSKLQFEPGQVSTGPAARSADLIPTFASDIYFFSRSADGREFARTQLFPAGAMPAEHLNASKTVTLGGLARGGRAGGRRVVFQILEAEHVRGPVFQLSEQRLNMVQNSFELPAWVIGKSVPLGIALEGGASGYEIVGRLSAREEVFRVPLLDDSLASREAPEPHPPSLAADHTLVDVLCIDMGTSNTAVVDLLQAGTIVLADLQSERRATEPPPAGAVTLEAGRPAAADAHASALEPVAEPSGASPSREVPVDEALPDRRRPESEIMPPPVAVPVPPQEILPPPAVAPSAQAASIVPPLAPWPSRRPFDGTEAEFVAEIANVVSRRGLRVERELIDALYLSLKVRPFVVLAGPPGVGKTSVVRALWTAFGATEAEGDALRLAVEAHWTDSRFVFGRGPSDGAPLPRMLERARTFPDRCVYALFDEMNLAHVEYYLAQILSAMESGGQIMLPDRPVAIGLPRSAAGLPLLRMFGTVNIDETTHGLSDKVLDRCNVIEMPATAPPERVGTSEAASDSAAPSWYVPATKLEAWAKLPSEISVPAVLREVWEDLQTGRPRISIGARVVGEISRFVAFALALLGEEAGVWALDRQLLQRVLPRVRGDGRLRPTLEKLEARLKQYGLIESQARVHDMIEQLGHEHFVSFWV